MVSSSKPNARKKTASTARKKAPGAKTGPPAPEKIADSAETASDGITKPASKAEAETPETPEPVAQQDVPDTMAGQAGDAAPPSDQTTEDSAKATAPPPVVVERRGGAVPMVVGGVLAAVIGFGVAQFVPDGWPAATPEDTSAPLTAALEAQAGEIEALKAAVAQAGDTSALSMQIAELNDALVAGSAQAARQSDRIDTVAAALETLDTRLSDVEKRPISEGADSGALAAYERELNAMRETLEAQRLQVEAMAETAASQIAAAERSATAATARAAFGRIQAALDSGNGYAGALSDLQAASDAELPEALTAYADSGVQTLASLTRSFPEAARAAIDAATRAGVDDGSVSRFSAFVRTQLGARSLSPHEGEDADAILSRAEAALHDGNLTSALKELSTLSEAGRAPMAGWVAQATIREQALGAAATLADALASN